MKQMTRAERWFWVQTLLPLPDKLYFDASYDEFLAALPDRPLGAAEIARLAFFAGAGAAFRGLADHEIAAEKMSEEDAKDDLAQLAIEPLEYLKRYGMGIE